MATKGTKKKSPAAVQAEPPKLLGAFELFKPSWNGLVFNILPLVQLFFFPTIVLAIGLSSALIAAAWHSTTVGNIMAITSALTIVAAAVLFILIAPAATHIQLKSAREEKADYQESFKAGLRVFWRYFGVSLLTGLIILVGLLLFIVPGLFMLRRYILATYYVVDKDLGVLEAMRQSTEESKKYSGPVWGLIGIQLLISAVGFIPLIGWFISLVLDVAYLYAPAVRYVEIRTAEKS